MSINATDYKNTLKRFASGVTVLSWHDENQNIQGITVSAFSALSLEPPLVLFCINQSAFVFPQLTRGKELAINIMAQGQSTLVYQFAGANREGLEQAIDENNPYHVPYLQGAHAHLTVRIEEQWQGGDHDIFVARVLHTLHEADNAPMIYHNGKLD